MQMFGAAFTETVNMIQISKLDETSEIIQNLLAFGIIAEIDDCFAQSLKDSFPAALQKNGKLSFKKLGGPEDDVDDLEINRSTMSRFLIGIYRICKLAYESVYFYFMPFMVILITFL